MSNKLSLGDCVIAAMGHVPKLAMTSGESKLTGIEARRPSKNLKFLDTSLAALRSSVAYCGQTKSGCNLGRSSR